VLNDGGGSSGQTTKVDYYLTSNSDCVSNSTLEFLDDDNLSSLGSGDNSNESEPVSIDGSHSAGQYYIMFVADGDNDLEELNEMNNTHCISITISGGGTIPTATISNPSSGQSFDSGETISIQGQINGSITSKGLNYSDDNGSSWNFIYGESTTTSLNVSWVAPNVNSSNYKIRLTLGYGNNQEVEFFSSGVFSINGNYYSLSSDAVPKW
jgi:hypothetical protein